MNVGFKYNDEDETAANDGNNEPVEKDQVLCVLCDESPQPLHFGLVHFVPSCQLTVRQMDDLGELRPNRIRV